MKCLATLDFLASPQRMSEGGMLLGHKSWEEHLLQEDDRGHWPFQSSELGIEISSVMVLPKGS